MSAVLGSVALVTTGCLRLESQALDGGFERVGHRVDLALLVDGQSALHGLLGRLELRHRVGGVAAQVRGDLGEQVIDLAVVSGLVGKLGLGGFERLLGFGELGNPDFAFTGGGQLLQRLVGVGVGLVAASV